MIEGFVSPEALALLFLFFGLTIAVLVKNLRSKYNWVPYTPTLFLVSVGLGYFSKDIGIIG
jgi:phosphate starvation-inducible membrane PsiE